MNGKKNGNGRAEAAKALAERKAAFVTMYQRWGSVGVACHMAGIKSSSSVYQWRDKDPEFAAVYEELKRDRTDELVTKLYDAAMGNLPLKQPQVTAAIFLLKAFDPKTFAEKYQHELIAEPGKPFRIEFVPADK